MPIRKGDNADELSRSAPQAPPVPRTPAQTSWSSGQPPTSAPHRTATSAIEPMLADGSFSVAFQPIVNLETAAIIGYEALLRSAPGGPFATPSEAFAAAAKEGLTARLDALARSLALDAASRWSDSLLLFINNSPEALIDPAFVSQVVGDVDRTSLHRHRIVFELTEWATVESFHGLDLRTLELREQGFRIAVDDVGSGINGLNQIMSIRPDWIKLDRQLVTDLDHDLLKQNLIRFLVHFARMSNLGLIAEGVERREVLETLIGLGVTHAQGFYLGRPGSADRPLNEKVRSCILAAHDRVAAQQIEGTSGVRLRTLGRPVVIGRAPLAVGDAAARLNDDPGAQGVVLVEKPSTVVGWLPRSRVFALTESGTPGAIDAHACSGILTMDGGLSIGEALHAIAARLESQPLSAVVVKERGQPAGIIELRGLLDAAADIHAESAAHISPLTGLPDRVHADRWLEQGIRIGDPCDVVMLDLCEFDTYNRTHGYELGDQMLRRLAHLLKRLLMERCAGAAFCAHLGADRFVIASSLDLHEIIEEFAFEFEQSLSEFFSPMEIACQSFKTGGNDVAALSRPLTAPRAVYLPQALLQYSKPRRIYLAADRLRQQHAKHDRARTLFIEADAHLQAEAADRAVA